MTMTHKLIRAALIISTQFATPAFAQAVIDEPGNYAFLHPNADVLNLSRPTDAMAAQPSPERNPGSLGCRCSHAIAAAPLPAKPY